MFGIIAIVLFAFCALFLRGFVTSKKDGSAVGFLFVAGVLFGLGLASLGVYVEMTSLP